MPHKRDKVETRRCERVFIEWDDAREGDDEEELKHDRCIQTTMGMVYKRNRWTLFVARDYNPMSGLFEKTIAITKKMIVNKESLGFVRVKLEKHTKD